MDCTVVQKYLSNVCTLYNTCWFSIEFLNFSHFLVFWALRGPLYWGFTVYNLIGFWNKNVIINSRENFFHKDFTFISSCGDYNLSIFFYRICPMQWMLQKLLTNWVFIHCVTDSGSFKLHVQPVGMACMRDLIGFQEL